MEPWLARAARVHGDRHALITGDGDRATYAELYERARSVAGALVRDRAVPGARVALALRSEDLVVGLHGCLLIGAVAVPIDLRLTAAERARRTAGAALVLEELDAAGAAD